MRLTISSEPLTLSAISSLIAFYRRLNPDENPDEIGMNAFTYGAMSQLVNPDWPSHIECVDRKPRKFMGIPIVINNLIRDGRVYCGERRAHEEATERVCEELR